MLTKEQIDILTDNYITGLYDDLESVVIGDIARRVKKMQRFTETAELMAVAMREQGYSTSRIQSEVYKAINADPDYQRELVKNTREYKQEIKQVIEQTETEAAAAGDVLVATAGDMSWNDDMQAWKLHDIDLKRPNGLDQLFRGMQRQTARQLRNITQTTGFKGTALGTTGVYNAFVRTMDMAVMKVATGTFSYQTACEDCVRQLAMSGLRTIDYSSGRSYQLDTAARMCVRTGMAQLSGKIQELNLQNGDTPLVYVDAHAGSRPEHAEWQGKVYAYDSNATLKDGSKAGEKYGDFFNETDYGSVTGLMGANCSHHFYPYWEGDPIPEFTMPDPMTIDGKEYTYYEATQEMRRQERNIRATRREIEATNALGGDTSALKRKLKMQESAYMDFSEKSKINPRQYALGVQTGTSNLNKTKAWQQAAKYASSPLNPEKAELDLDKSFRPESLGYNDNLTTLIAEKAKELAQLSYQDQVEYGMLISLDGDVCSEPLKGETDYVFISDEAYGLLEGHKYAFLHTHTTKTDVSLGDAYSVINDENMDSIIAARLDGVLTSLKSNGKIYKRHWSETLGEEYRRLYAEGKYTSEEIDYKLRDILIKGYVEGNVRRDG